MKIDKHCQEDFDNVKNGDFLLIMADEEKKKGDIGLPVNYERLVVKVIDKEKHRLMRFPKELMGNHYSDESLIQKIAASLELYEAFQEKESNFFREMEQNYVIWAIIPIKKEIVEEAIRRELKHFQYQKDAIQRSMDKLEADLKEAKILS